MCDKLSTAVATVKAHSAKYERDLDAVVIFLTQDIDKRGSIPSVNAAFIT